MEELYYHGYFIRAVTQQTHEGWTAGGRVRREKGGRRYDRPFYPPGHVFATEEQARDYAFAFGKRWVDSEG